MPPKQIKPFFPPLFKGPHDQKTGGKCSPLLKAMSQKEHSTYYVLGVCLLSPEILRWYRWRDKRGNGKVLAHPNILYEINVERRILGAFYKNQR